MRIKHEADFLDMTPICDKCGKTAPVDKEMSTKEWVVYRTKEPCECGGKFMPKCFMEKGK
jgi:lysyl-tRNA synthetase class I